MARTVTEIYDALVAEKQTMATLNGLQPSVDTSQTLLSDLTNTSKVALWRLFLFLVATAMWVEETLWDDFKVEIEDKIVKGQYGGSPWFQDQCFKFQLGYTLVWLDNQFKYTDTTSGTALAAQIIKRAAIVESGGQVRIKVAKLVGSVVTKLSGAELTAFDDYIRKIKPAGTNTLTISADPDLLKVSIRAYYNPEVLASDGSLLTDGASFPLEDAINNYISNLPFNGRLSLTALVDAMQAANGIVNPELLTAEAKYGALAYAAIVTEYIPDAGHLTIDPAYPLSSSITYIPYV